MSFNFKPGHWKSDHIISLFQICVNIKIDNIVGKKYFLFCVHVCFVLQVIDELSEIMKLSRDKVAETVHESKCDELSAMFNMMMDSKRNEKGNLQL